MMQGSVIVQNRKTKEITFLPLVTWEVGRLSFKGFKVIGILNLTILK